MLLLLLLLLWLLLLLLLLDSRLKSNLFKLLPRGLECSGRSYYCFGYPNRVACQTFSGMLVIKLVAFNKFWRNFLDKAEGGGGGIEAWGDKDFF